MDASSFGSCLGRRLSWSSEAKSLYCSSHSDRFNHDTAIRLAQKAEKHEAFGEEFRR